MNQKINQISGFSREENKAENNQLIHSLTIIITQCRVLNWIFFNSTFLFSLHTPLFGYSSSPFLFFLIDWKARYQNMTFPHKKDFTFIINLATTLILETTQVLERTMLLISSIVMIKIKQILKKTLLKQQ